MITTPIELELKKLGLTEKEVRVYLAGLELGPSSVKKIAEMARVTRPTAYEIIKGLEKKGLFAETPKERKQKKKRLFAVQSPERILGILRTQKREIEEKEREFIRIISSLRSKYYLKNQSEIRAYEDKEGLKALINDFSQSQTNEILIVTNDSQFLNPWRKKLPEIKKRLGRLKLKEIKNKKDFPGTLIIYDKLIYLPSFTQALAKSGDERSSSTGKHLALVIENKEIVKMVKGLINSL